MIRAAFFSLFVAIGTLVSPLAGPAQAAQPETVTLDVEGMTCGACPITVRLALRRVPGVIDARVDFDSRTATVTYDPDKTTVQALTKATADAGYPSTVRSRQRGE